MVLENLHRLLAAKGFKLFTRPGELNIVGVRSKNLSPATFDDEFFVFWADAKKAWSIRRYKGTTDPGTYFLKNPMQSRGTAIVKEGQYLNCFQIGKHKGEYDALVQAGPIRILIDNNRDGVLDLKNAKSVVVTSGINLHRAKLDGKSIDIGKWSAGCQVIADSGDFSELLGLAKRHQGLYGKVSYSLIDLRDYQNLQLKQVAVIGAGLLATAMVLSGNNSLATAFEKIQTWLTDDDDKRN